jgi:predicted GTPase
MSSLVYIICEGKFKENMTKEEVVVVFSLPGTSQEHISAQLRSMGVELGIVSTVRLRSFVKIISMDVKGSDIHALRNHEKELTIFLILLLSHRDEQQKKEGKDL